MISVHLAFQGLSVETLPLSQGHPLYWPLPFLTFLNTLLVRETTAFSNPLPESKAVFQGNLRREALCGAQSYVRPLPVPSCSCGWTEMPDDALSAQHPLAHVCAIFPALGCQLPKGGKCVLYHFAWYTAVAY